MHPMPAPLQLELAPAMDLRDPHGFETAVRSAGGWVLGRQLCERAGWAWNDEHQRGLRLLANACPRVISGNKGYCHEDNATVEEINHCVNRLLSQVREMAARVTRLRQAAHRRLHGVQ